MSNVQYVCSGPNGQFKCGAKLFAAPGGTALKCRHHPEDSYVQTEEFHGNLRTYTDEIGKKAGEGERGTGLSGVKPIGDPTAKAQITIPSKVTPGNLDVDKEKGKLVEVVDPDNLPEDLAGLRRAYELVFGEPADRRFREAKLGALISIELERQAEMELALKAQEKEAGQEKEEEDEQPEDVQEEVPTSTLEGVGEEAPEASVPGETEGDDVGRPDADRVHGEEE